MRPKDKMKQKRIKREKRHKRVRSKVFGTSKRPRLAIYKSIKHIYAQIIDDTTSNTLIAFSDLNLEKKEIKDKKKLEIAKLVGEKIASKALKKGIKKVVFDRGGFKYHGRIKALADAAREKGLIF